MRGKKYPNNLGVEWRVVFASYSKNPGVRDELPNDLITCFLGLSCVSSLSQKNYVLFLVGYCLATRAITSEVGTQMESTLLC